MRAAALGRRSPPRAYRPTINQERDYRPDYRHDNPAAGLLGAVEPHHATEIAPQQRSRHADEHRDDKPAGISSGHEQLSDRPDDQPKISIWKTSLGSGVGILSI